MEWRNFVMILLFVFGILVGDVYSRIVHDMKISDCGFKPGHTTLVTEDNGDLICIYRQNGYPFKTQSGRHV
jgi:hypothetical protein